MKDDHGFAEHKQEEQPRAGESRERLDGLDPLFKQILVLVGLALLVVVMLIAYIIARA